MYNNIANLKNNNLFTHVQITDLISFGTEATAQIIPMKSKWFTQCSFGHNVTEGSIPQWIQGHNFELVFCIRLEFVESKRSDLLTWNWHCKPIRLCAFLEPDFDDLNRVS